MASSAASAASSSPSASGVVSWRDFTPDRLASIESARAADRARPLVREVGAQYGSICRACSKPNSEAVDYCTGCNFPSQPEDIQKLPENIFLQLVHGEDIGAVVHHRDAHLIVFDDKYPVSDNHLDIIPTEVYADCTTLGREHIHMLEQLYAAGRREMASREIPWLAAATAASDAPETVLDSFLTCGYNYPVSVLHLHLHMVLPPFRHEKVFDRGGPRWHSHAKVLADLREYGAVRTYKEYPNAAECETEYQRAMNNSAKAQKIIASIDKKQSAL
jgi:diadenosine tetraphosphate (Ap4A) HIT family hydrolase